MENWLWDLIPWGYQILLEIEKWRSPILDAVFSGITEMGNEFLLIVLFTLLYWCFNKQIGILATCLWLTSTYLNNWLKHHWSIPRPADTALDSILQKASIDGRLGPLFHEESPSWPSNHTQGALVTWGYLAWRVHQPWFRLAAVTLAGLVAFSRMYGGVHFPQDIIGGVLIGLIVLALWVVVEIKLGPTLETLSFALQLGLLIALSLIAFFLYATPDSALVAGTLIGMAGGYLWQEQKIRFDPQGVLIKRVVRGLLGLAIVMGAQTGLRALFGLIDIAALEALLRGFRYGLVGLIASFFVPWLFVKIKLAEQLPKHLLST